MRFIALNLLLIALIAAAGCYRLTGAQEQGVQHGTAVVGTIFGLPPAVGEAIGLGIVSILAGIAGHKNGRRCERKKAKAPANG